AGATAAGAVPVDPAGRAQVGAAAGERVALLLDLVDDAVAVVVLAVANLGRGIGRADADELSALALEGAGLARAHVDAAGGAHPRHRPVVDLAVAIVVEAVADLLAAAGALDAVVDEAVAIVVDAVADLVGLARAAVGRVAVGAVLVGVADEDAGA